MLRVPWAPLNGGVFLIIFGTVMLLSIVGAGGLSLSTGIPLIFLAFGAWLILVAFVVHGPDDRYAPPRSMILAWGGMVAFLGAAWLVATYNLLLVPAVILVVIIVLGIGAVGYALTRAESRKAHPPVA
ncbi:MAG TPA: hypothetical protein VGS11_09110 [Candidatus Bathyarchaeia archaeon]|nr:hypothetical protein [Candidatus Bathyarchaeia archaeon]